MPHRVIVALNEVQLYVDLALLHAEAFDAAKADRTHQLALLVEA